MLRRLILGVTLLLLVALGITGWTAWRALQARDDLTKAQVYAEKVQNAVREGDLDGAAAALPMARQELDRAADRTSGWTWSVAVHVPIAGRNLQAVQRAGQAGQVLGDDVLPR